jgi:hypothetical protein
MAKTAENSEYFRTAKKLVDDPRLIEEGEFAPLQVARAQVHATLAVVEALNLLADAVIKSRMLGD